MPWIEVESGERVDKKHFVSTQLSNKISTLESIADDIAEIIEQINFVMDGTDTSMAQGWMRCCMSAKDEHILGGGRAKEALTRALEVVASLSDCEWEWFEDDDD